MSWSFLWRCCIDHRSKLYVARIILQRQRTIDSVNGRRQTSELFEMLSCCRELYTGPIRNIFSQSAGYLYEWERKIWCIHLSN